LGDASYSIYLIHYITLNAISLIYTKTNFFWQGDLMIWLQLIVSTTIAILFYRYVEMPLLNKIHKMLLVNKTIKPKKNNASIEPKELVTY
jgi:peptidoglycan/LPS O-acetylase OafA/YrhL